MGGCRKGPCCKVTTGIVGLICVVTGCVLIEVFDTLIHNKVEDSLPLKEGSESYKNWVSPPAPIYFSVYLQHVVNAEEVVQTGAKPTLVEMGPYTYRERREKVNITFQDGNTSVSYQENQWYYFDRNRSAGPESDVVTTINLPMLTIANIVRFEFGAFQWAVDELLRVTGERLFINLTVAELMWGYEDPLLKDVKDLAHTFHFNLTLDDKFGLFLNKNGSNDGVYKVKTGSGGTIKQFAQIVTWNGKSSLDFWNSTQANSLNGSDGTMYPPFVTKDTVLYLFSSDICRSLEIRYTKDYTLKGIDVDRFVVPPMTLANVSVNPANEGFCTPFCLPAGVLNASVCRDGAPVILSLPHFLDGDPRVRDRINGMMPKREDHQSVIDIEPMTGVVMNAAKRIQLNAYLNKIPHIKDTDQLKDYVILPILWLSESATIDDKSASDFKSEVLMAVRVTEAVKYGLIALGGVLLLGLLLFLMTNAFCRRSKDREMATFGETAPILS